MARALDERWYGHALVLVACIHGPVTQPLRSYHSVYNSNPGFATSPHRITVEGEHCDLYTSASATCTNSTLYRSLALIHYFLYWPLSLSPPTPQGSVRALLLHLHNRASHKILPQNHTLGDTFPSFLPFSTPPPPPTTELPAPLPTTPSLSSSLPISTSPAQVHRKWHGPFSSVAISLSYRYRERSCRADLSPPHIPGRFASE